jgi:hypothetical protein
VRKRRRSEYKIIDEPCQEGEMNSLAFFMNGVDMKKELMNSLEELNGLIFKGLREENPENKMVPAMHIALRLGHIKMMVEKLGNLCSDVQGHA